MSAFDGVETTDPSSFDVDHFVPLSEAWASGARNWDANTRERFANDLAYEMSLIAVSASSNRSKSDSDPSEWTPPASEYKCEYVFAWVNVKSRWNLSVDNGERMAIESAWTGCSVSELDFSATAVSASVTEQEPEPEPEPTPEPAPEPNPEPTPEAELDPRFGSCTEARANGYSDYVAGVDPEYEWYQDRDKDGVVCETTS